MIKISSFFFICFMISSDYMRHILSILIVLYTFLRFPMYAAFFYILPTGIILKKQTGFIKPESASLNFILLIFNFKSLSMKVLS